MKYMSLAADKEGRSDLLALSTEDGRVIFFSTQDLQEAETDADASIPFATPIAQIGGKQAGFPGRIKDFEILSLEDQPKELRVGSLVVTGNSEGTVRIWKLDSQGLFSSERTKGSEKPKHTIRQVGKLLVTYETGNRITCLASYIMLPASDSSTLPDLTSEEETDEEVSSSDDSDDE